MILTTNVKTLGEFINENYADFEVFYGSAPMDMDITHGVEVETHDNRKHGYGMTVNLYPCIEWTDGLFKPCHYWGSRYYISLMKR